MDTPEDRANVSALSLLEFFGIGDEQVKLKMLN
jgi:hypothetical protein